MGSELPEVYVSECCGALFVPGHGPDNIVEAEPGWVPVELSGAPGASQRTVRQRKVRDYEADEYDAVRHGPCPSCAHEGPMMTEVPYA